MRNFVMVNELSLCWGFVVLLCDPIVPLVRVDLHLTVYRRIFAARGEHPHLARHRIELDTGHHVPGCLCRLHQGRGVALPERGWAAGHQWFAFGSVHAFSS